MLRRKRIITALNGGQPDRPPISFGVGPGAEESNVLDVYRYFGAEDKNGIYESASIDGFNVWAWNAVMGKYIGPVKRLNDGTELDFWGNYEQTHFGLLDCDSVEELENHRWPCVENFDFSHIYQKANEIRQKDMAVAAGHLGVGYQMHVMLRGYEKAFMDVTDEKYTFCLVEYLTDFTVNYIDALLDAGKGLIDVVRADDDVGTMDRLMISPTMWRKYYKPAWKKVFDVVHSYGAKIWFHSCGYIMPLMDDLMEIGIDCWNPFPPNVKGNDHQKLKDYRKGKIALDGGVSHPLLVQGSTQEVSDETKKVLDTFAPDGGLLIGPAQVFTKDMPSENIIAFLETAVNYKG
jgi:uroporphyrinogen decarboxylase